MIITEAGVEAAPLLAALHARGIGEAGPAWDAQAIAALLALPGRTALIATRGETSCDGVPCDGAPWGFLLLGIAADEAEILTLAVLPEARQQGVGRALMAAASAWVMGRAVGRAVTLLLEVAEDNAPASALYAAMGFAPVGRRRGYYARKGGAADALVLALPLGDCSEPRCREAGGDGSGGRGGADFGSTRTGGAGTDAS